MGTPIDPGAVQGGDGNAPGPNPAWNDVLSQVPEQYHSAMTQEFQKWDSAAQQKIEAANQQVKAFEPYKAFLDNQIPADEMENGLRLMYELNTNPQQVYDALGQAYGLTPQQVQQVAQQQGMVPDPNSQQQGQGQQSNSQPQQQYQDPRFDKLQQGIELVSQIVLSDQQQKQQAQEDARLSQELKSLETQHGNFDERFVLAMMQNGMNGADAVKAFQSMRTEILQNGNSFAPDIIGSSSGGTGYPSQQIDPTKLTGTATRDLVKQILDAENRNG